MDEYSQQILDDVLQQIEFILDKNPDMRITDSGLDFSKYKKKGIVKVELLIRDEN